jgi:hypothetical protein
MPEAVPLPTSAGTLKSDVEFVNPEERFSESKVQTVIWARTEAAAPSSPQRENKSIFITANICRFWQLLGIETD